MSVFHIFSFFNYGGRKKNRILSGFYAIFLICINIYVLKQENPEMDDFEERKKTLCSLCVYHLHTYLRETFVYKVFFLFPSNVL